MRDIWVISDTHFQHSNILTFRHEGGELIRGNLFSSVEEHDEYLVTQWNRYVKPGDKVYHLGDVFMGNKDSFIKLWNRLNGQKRLILGNHDDAKFFAKNNLVSKIDVWRMWPEFGLLFTHVPVDPSILQEHRWKGVEAINVHGHLHQNPSPTKFHRNVSVEQIDYTPINIDELRIR